jgi:two-component system phosphate regulon sensor histidine kinase PhoR
MVHKGDYTKVLSIIRDGVIIVGTDSIVLYINDAARNIFSINSTPNRSVTFIEAVRDYECDALMHRCISSGKEQEADVTTRGGTHVLKIQALPLPEYEEYLFIAIDLTEKYRLETINRDLMSNISHEFRTPIASIKLIVETLLGNKPAANSIENNWLRKIDIEADKLAQIAGELQVISREQKDNEGANKSSVDIGELIGSSIVRMKAYSDKQGIEVSSEYEIKLPHVVVDGSQIERVIINLLHNAIKFNRQGGKVVIAASSSGGMLMVEVRDTGIGIEREDVGRVFERFYKADKSRSGEGTGLGLTISRHIIRAHGGKIWAESEPGKGASFFFTLPL